ncbi:MULTISPECIES: bifunctional serine/threonine-protein kinase/ABC transporter substrate-binding protein [Streptomyces]|uniref:Bifunctional serine/threonine-protein kinase/ABC transporter substrate-binding protein n=1 Tax=Streptomyces sudanensis TaxID=436397 RepID=A0ABY4TCA0_9ACTN|nr:MULTISPECIES: bifunctional serine/threonine-protein kinase/ABC transporter substrate-binding protein [Streptomyces]URN16584.1 bifunctional serine/threonine-protein kinase/ABC transporter substrate-binding protein [Streptomyces sudanensis]
MDPLRRSDPARIAGHRLLGRLGEGGMGVVYLARTPGGSLVAVKVVQEEYADDAGFRERFRREVEAARRISSRWAVRLVDAGPDDAAPWLATEFLPGPSLAEAVALHGPLPPWGLRVLGARLAEALDDIHAVGLVHRDVKPGNVLLAPDGPRLIDFGIARAPEDTSLTATGIVVGTPGYLAPEQAGAGDVARVGPAGDMFSLGCVLVYAATGRPPFGTGPVDALLYRTVHDDADVDGVPEETAGVIGGCLEKDPRLRPTAVEVRRALAEGGTGAEEPARWLPEPVLRLIAERSTAALDLPGIDDTEVSGEFVSGDAAGTRGPGRSAPAVEGGNAADEPGAAAGRRRFLALSGGAALVAAGGGTALWAAVGREEAAPAVKPRRPRYTLALHADLSGADKATGRAQERGLRLAVEQFNARRGRPYTLAVRTEDDGGDPRAASRVAKTLAADPAVLAVVGPTTDATAEACLMAYDAALVPVAAVSPGATSLTIQGYRSFLQARFADALLAVSLSIYLRGFAKSRRVGIVEDRAAGNHAWAVANNLSDLLHDEGHPQVPRVVSALRKDFRPVADAMLKAGADSVVFAGYPDRAAQIARVLHDRRFTGARLSTQPILDERFLTAAGEAAEGWLAVAPAADPALLPAGAAFTAAHRRRFGGAPARYSVEAYDTANMFLAGLERLGTARPTRAALLTAVRGTPYQGITKRLAFEKTGELTISRNNGIFLWRVERSAFRCEGPVPLGTYS